MSLFNKIMGNRNEANASDNSKIGWIHLTEITQLDALKQESNHQPVAIFKHSTRCGISRMVLNGFERDFDLPEGEVKMYFLDLIQYREISNEIANRYEIRHESPQLILLKNGKVVHHSSHSDIAVKNLKN